MAADPVEALVQNVIGVRDHGRAPLLTVMAGETPVRFTRIGRHVTAEVWDDQRGGQRVAIDLDNTSDAGIAFAFETLLEWASDGRS